METGVEMVVGRVCGDGMVVGRVCGDAGVLLAKLHNRGTLP